jgi:uncharacterized protein (TIGR03000 family)
MRLRTAAVACVLLGLAALGTAHGQQATPKAQPATLRIKMPYPSATLTINGVQTSQQSGSTRIFVTPPLEPDDKHDYFYTVVAFWEPNNYTKITRTREIKVVPGKEVELDLNQEDPKFPDKVVVRYVPTPPEVVEAMLQLAKVSKDDVVYDLGCGDGRMVIAAVKSGAKRGVGIDLDPQRLKECAENAKSAGVEDKVTFRQGDVLKVEDLSDATVIMLYMGNELNIRLRPILWAKLKPGTRIVSHRFTMGDWKPEKSETLTVRGEKFNIHLWTITGKEGKEDPK